MANQVDSLDEQILAALQSNGRLTMKSLAEQVGLSSPGTTNYSPHCRDSRSTRS
jgi:DNA-binding Lrp family transcriptional regulator